MRQFRSPGSGRAHLRREVLGDIENFHGTVEGNAKGETLKRPVEVMASMPSRQSTNEWPRFAGDGAGKSLAIIQGLADRNFFDITDNAAIPVTKKNNP